MKEKILFYRPAAAAFLTMMAMSLTSSTLSFFLDPVCAALGISRGSYSLIFSLLAVSGALTNPILGQYAGRKGVRGILILSGLWVCGSMLLFSQARQLWMLYLAGFLMGGFATNCAALCANVAVQQSYNADRASGIMGVVMAGSGAGGMIFSILIPGCIHAFGWRVGAAAMGASWLALCLAAAAVLGREETPQAHSAAAAAGLGMTRAQALKSPKLYLLMVVIVIITACCGIQQQLPSMLSGYGFPAEKVSVMISVMTAFLAVGKILQGALCAGIGVRRGISLMLGVFAAGFLVMLSKNLAWPGLVLLAFGMGIYTTLMPMVVRTVFGTREYAAIWALIATVGSVGTFVANPLWGTICDLSGSYDLGLLICPVLLVGAIAAVFRAMKEEPAP